MKFSLSNTWKINWVRRLLTFLRNTDTTQNDTEDTESAYGGWLEIDEEDLE